MKDNLTLLLGVVLFLAFVGVVIFVKIANFSECLGTFSLMYCMFR
jgi:hypothetical protein